jgi:WD40 repeat protein
VLEGHGSFVEAAAFSPDGSMLATGDDDGEVRLWDVATRIELLAFEAHPGGVSDVAFAPDGRLLVTAGADATAAVWDIDDLLSGAMHEPRRLTGHLGAVLSVGLSADGQVLATGGEDARVMLWSAGTGDRLLELTAQGDAVAGVAFTPDGSRLLAASRDGVTRTYLLDVRDLVGLARSRAPRALTDAECEEHLRAPCPAT